jgi:hypothetical protein
MVMENLVPFVPLSRCRNLGRRLTGHHDNDTIPANLYARNTDARRKYSLRGAGHVGFLEFGRTAHRKPLIDANMHF